MFFLVKYMTGWEFFDNLDTNYEKWRDKINRHVISFGLYLSQRDDIHKLLSNIHLRHTQPFHGSNNVV
jgi:hypothetical protein